jgi:hypothetical protein
MSEYESMLVQTFPGEVGSVYGMENATHSHYSIDKVCALANATDRYITKRWRLVELFDLVFMMRVATRGTGKCGCEIV